MSITTTPVEENGAAAAQINTMPEIFGENPWRKTAPAQVKKADISSCDGKAWHAWREILRERAKGLALWQRESASPLRWGLETEPSELSLLDDIYGYSLARRKSSSRKQPKTTKKSKKAKKSKANRQTQATDFPADQVVRAWLAESEGAAVSSSFVTESLAWCYALPRLAQDLPAGLWWELAGRLVETVRDAQKEDPQSAPAAFQILAAEAALVLGAGLDDLRVCRDLAKAGGAALVAAFDQLLDGEGTPHRDYLAELRPLAASWLRCLRLLDNNDLLANKQVRKALKQFDEVLLGVARLSRLDGSQHLGPGGEMATALSSSFVRHLADAAEDPDVGTALRVAFGLATRAADAEEADDHFDVAKNAEWSDLAVLRSSWRQFSPRIVVDYGQAATRLELSAGKRELLAGALNTQLTIDGSSTPVTSSWSCVCWQSDSDCDYLELETHPAPGFLLQRSIMLAHEDCFAWIADSIAWGREHTVEYQIKLPLANGISCDASDEHTELELRGKKKSLARVLPIALPEWRSAARNGQLQAENGQLTLRQSQHGWGMYAGVFIDLEPPRLKRQFTWRQLTVAEDRKILTPDLAVAQRVQCGNKHWVFYRSIGARGNRTFLGINVSTELLAARFDTDGEYETLVEVL